MDLELFLKISGILFTGVFAIVVDRLIRPKPKLVHYVLHPTSVLLKSDQGSEAESIFQVNTHSIVIRNVGRKVAEEVSVGHHMLPNYRVYPDTYFNEVELSQGGIELVFPKLRPKEQLTITYLYYPPNNYVDVHSYVKHNDGFSREIPVLPAQQYSKWIYCLTAMFMALGIATTIYWIARVTVWSWQYYNS